MMRVATKTVTLTDSDGRPWKLKAGITQHAEEDYLVKTYREFWRPVEPGRERRQRECIRPAGERVAFVPAGSAAGVRNRTPALTPRRANLPKPKPDYGREEWRLHAWTPHLSAVAVDRFSRVRVKLDAWPQILEIVERTTALDGFESGGLLLGKSWHDFVQIVRVSGPGPSAVRERSRLVPDVVHDGAVAIEARRQGFAPVGSWHTHPSGFRARVRATWRPFTRYGSWMVSSPRSRSSSCPAKLNAGRPRRS